MMDPCFSQVTLTNAERRQRVGGRFLTGEPRPAQRSTTDGVRRGSRSVGCEMPEPEPKRAEHNAGAFAGPADVGGGIPVPMSTLSDEYHDDPTEPEDSDRVPESEPPSLTHRVAGWLRGRLVRT